MELGKIFAAQGAALRMKFERDALRVVSMEILVSGEPLMTLDTTPVITSFGGEKSITEC